MLNWGHPLQLLHPGIGNVNWLNESSTCITPAPHFGKKKKKNPVIGTEHISNYSGKGLGTYQTTITTKGLHTPSAQATTRHNFRRENSHIKQQLTTGPVSTYRHAAKDTKTPKHPSESRPSPNTIARALFASLIRQWSTGTYAAWGSARYP